jgi:hypothetical protein
MARSAKKSRLLAKFKYPAAIEIREAEFSPLDSVRHLDVEALGNAAAAEIELGYVNTCCQRLMVRAVIRRGMVTRLRTDEPPKKDRTRISSDLAKILRRARTAARKRSGQSPKFPIPVAQFLSQRAALGIQTLQCIRVCFLFDICITCCWRTDIPNAQPICGHLSIDTTVLD